MKRMKTARLLASIILVVGAALGWPGLKAYAQEVEPDPAQKLLSEALALMDEEQYARAEDACRQAITTDPKCEVDARLTLAEIYYAQGRFEDAVGEAKKAHEKAQETGEAEEVIAEAKRMFDYFVQAQARFKITVARLKEKISSAEDVAEVIDAECRLADVLFVASRRQEAMAHCWSLIQKYPDSNKALLHAVRRLAIVFLWQAKALPEAAREERIEKFEVFTRGMVYGKEDLSKLEESCRQAIAAHPHYEPEAVLTLAEIYFVRGQFKKAQKEALKVLEKAREAPVRPEYVAEAWKAIKDYVEAEERFEQKVAELKKTIASAAKMEDAISAELRLGSTFFVAGKAEEAIGLYEAMIPKYADILEAVKPAIARLKLLYLPKYGPETALSKFQALTDAYPGTKTELCGHYWMGEVHYSQGQNDKAISRFEIVAGKFPQSVLAPRALGSILDVNRRTKQFPQAIETAQRLIEQYPRSRLAFGALEKLEEACREAESLQEAIATSDLITRRHPESPLAPRSLEMVCRVYGDKKMFVGAISTADRIRREYPLSVSAPRALEEAYYNYRQLKNLAEVERGLREALSAAATPEQRAEVCLSLYRLAEAYRRGRNIPDAERVLSAADEAFAGAEKTPALLTQRGYELMDFGRLRDAQEAFRQALQKEPANLHACFGMVEASARIRKPEQALQLLPTEELTAGKLLRAAEIFGRWDSPRSGRRALEFIEERDLKGYPLLATRFRKVRINLLKSSLAAAQAELLRAQRLAEVMAARAEATSDPAQKETYIDRSRSYQEKARRAQQSLDKLQEELQKMKSESVVPRG